MKHEEVLSTDLGKKDSNSPKPLERRSFLKGIGVTGAVLSAAPLLGVAAHAKGRDSGGSLSQGDAAILRFVAAAEIIESDIWLQYNELAGVQDGEVSKLASQLIPGYPAQVTGGNADYTNDVKQLDGDMDQYISDNTEDELTHEVFLNAYLAAKGAATISLDAFRTLPSSQATGSNKTFARITNLTQLTVHTDWWTRYRSRTGNPDLGDKFRNAFLLWPLASTLHSPHGCRCQQFDVPASCRQYRWIPFCLDRAGREQLVSGTGAAR